MVTYQPGSNFESCPAATGQARPGCTDFPDRAHRCAKEREHVQREAGHKCTCGFGWISATIGDGKLSGAPDPGQKMETK